jgi:hypothetical protein
MLKPLRGGEQQRVGWKICSISWNYQVRNNMSSLDAGTEQLDALKAGGRQQPVARRVADCRGRDGRLARLAVLPEPTVSEAATLCGVPPQLETMTPSASTTPLR